MSNFQCEKCGAICYDTPNGYITGCEHYPVNKIKRPTRIKESQVFKPLKEAIERVLASYNDYPNVVTEQEKNFVPVPVDDLRVLMLIYNEFFTEPEDDKEWNEWRSK